jgi:hypothetical protein
MLAYDIPDRSTPTSRIPHALRLHPVYPIHLSGDWAFVANLLDTVPRLLDIAINAR